MVACSSRLSLCWDARTLQNGRHTRVRRGDARAMPLPARQCRIQFFFFSFPDSRRLGPICSDSGCIGPYRAKPPIQAEI
uniref:Uncharacterized protein n=1 Tax=Quercus lobata TaxID=97700 RepID=A0A7N2MXI3_QUELO